MKIDFLRTMLLVLLASAGTSLAAVDGVTLETSVYHFRSSDFSSVKIPGERRGDRMRSFVFQSPATAQFGNQTLSLDRTRFAWSEGRNPPEGFGRIATPSVILAPGEPVSLRSTAAVQYLEKGPADSLQLREISDDSPDAPRWELTFTLATGTAEDDRVRLACDVDVTTMSAREKLPGVMMDVGKPVLERFSGELNFDLTPEEWAGFMAQAPSGGDSCLLVLLKAGPAPTPKEAAATERSMTAEEIAEFATHYYLRPQPESVARMIESLGKTRFLNPAGGPSLKDLQQATTFVGFLGEIFAANPERLAHWRNTIERSRMDRETLLWLQLSLDWGRSRAKFEKTGTSGLALPSMYWGAFLGSGNVGYLRKLVDRIELVDSADFGPFEVGARAMMTFAHNAPHHPLVRQTLEAARPEASRRTRKLIDLLLTKNVAQVQEKLSGMKPRSLPSMGVESYNMHPWGIPLPQPSGDFAR